MNLQKCYFINIYFLERFIDNFSEKAFLYILINFDSIIYAILLANIFNYFAALYSLIFTQYLFLFSIIEILFCYTIQPLTTLSKIQ